MDDGSISDGDELGNTTELPQSPTVQVRGVKRKRGDDSGETAGRSGSAPGPTPASPILISSSPIRDDEEYDDHDNVREFIQQRINELREGANILEGQLRNPEASKIWLKSMKNRNIGGDVSKMVSDIQHFTQTGRLCNWRLRDLALRITTVTPAITGSRACATALGQPRLAS
ncbi:hypothetical protein B0H13DRAFT_1851335 [Mycena leptocephala]|nr:hypothetical protein B0H13DRAFT_1851335 [Mycena leptocephala]